MPILASNFTSLRSFLKERPPPKYVTPPPTICIFSKKNLQNVFFLHHKIHAVGYGTPQYGHPPVLGPKGVIFFDHYDVIIFVDGTYVPPQVLGSNWPAAVPFPGGTTTPDNVKEESWLALKACFKKLVRLEPFTKQGADCCEFGHNLNCSIYFSILFYHLFDPRVLLWPEKGPDFCQDCWRMPRP